MRKRTVSSGIVKWFSIVVAPYILLVILLNVMAYRTSVERVRESLSNTLRLQAFDIEDQLAEMENSIQHLCGDNHYYFMVLQHNTGEMETYLSRQELYQQMRRYTLASSAQEGMFLYPENSGELLFSGPDFSYEEQLEIRDFLAGYLPGRDVRESRIWVAEEIAGEHYVVYFLRLYGSWVGSCAKVSSVIDTMIRSQPEILRDAGLYLQVEGTGYRVTPEGNVVEDVLPAGKKNRIQVEDPSGTVTLFLYPGREWTALSGGSYIGLMVLLSGMMISALPAMIKGFGRKITRPVEDLEEGMRLLQRGNFEAKLTAEYEFVEMESIRDTYNEMTQRIKVLKNDVYEEKLLRQKTEYDFLQIQVKPHFYLNCLNQVYILARMNKGEAVADLASCLVRYFRYLLHTDSGLVPLERELAHIEDFLSIQKLRYPAGFRYQCDLEPGLEAVALPPMLLLTFVENSLQYALSVYGETRVAITGRAAAGTCRICLEDSGPGFPPEILSALQQVGEDGKLPGIRTQEGRSCIGITNAIQRLRFALGGRASISFSNGSPLGGAYVSIELPLGGKEDMP